MSQRATKVWVVGTCAVFLAALTGAGVYTSGLQTVRIEDRCDPATFNLDPPDGAGPGVCIGHERGIVTFEEFVEVGLKEGGHPQWHFAPDEFDVKRGESINAANLGGEVHSFTPVAAFGGGVVPQLNAIAGIDPNEIVPECVADLILGTGQTIVPPGATTHPVQLNTVGRQKLQCCIHPWMRTEITVRNK